MSRALRVSVRLEGRELSSHTFRGDRIVIGRDADCDVRLDNSAVSRHHALIERSGPGYLLRDLGSSSGAIVGDDAIASIPIADGARARIRNFDLAFELVDDEPSADAGDPSLQRRRRESARADTDDEAAIHVPKVPERVACYPIEATEPETRGWSTRTSTLVFVLACAAVAAAIYWTEA